MTPFDPLHVPLHGVRLIEAGAGTGKTYQIEGLFLRLILEAGLFVDQVLVLTFTVAATEELRRRIRDRLLALRRALSGEAVGDDLVAGLVEAAPDRSRALRAVEGALLDFDRAAIYTIHGFCQRLLTDHAFETGTLFDTELAVDPSDLIDEAASDFWRRHAYDAEPELAAYFTEQKMAGPDAFASLLHRLQRPTELRIAGGGAVAEWTALEPFRRRFRRLQTLWTEARPGTADALLSPALKAPAYGSLEKKDPGTGRSLRRTRVAAMCRDMDRFLAPGSIGFPLFDGFDRFTASKLAAATRKGAETPQHPFFSACDALARAEARLRGEMEQRLSWMKTAFAQSAEERLADHKGRKNVLFYEDLLLRSRDALRTDPNLAAAVRDRFRAALVDEFQDTDPVQYEIFRRLFAGPSSAMFMIGDPKQAIYGFRGADVFSYLGAVHDADARYSLVENWRSTPGLIEGVNALFSFSPRPFLLEGIGFSPARFPLKKKAEEETGESAPLEIWWIPGREDGKPRSKAEAGALLNRCVADEIGGMLRAGTEAGRIAVLVRTNRQARNMKASLAERGIPAVLYSAGSVFETAEAEELHRLLAGIGEPGRVDLLRGALCTELIGVAARELIAAETDASWWSRRGAPLAEDLRTWREAGFIRMFRRLMTREKVRQRLLKLPDGERRLTNLLHLVELCHRAAVEKGLGPTGLLKWLHRRRAAAASPDEAQLRLESDARAVQVVTVHRSKGLQFPVVFVPFGWEADAGRLPEEPVFHDPDAGFRLTAELGGGDRQRSERLARTEALAEDLRLLYVAATRAEKRCILAWGRIRQAEMSPLAYLFHGGHLSAASDPAKALEAHVKTLSEEALFDPLERLAAAAPGGSVAVSRLEPEKVIPAAPNPGDLPELAVRSFSGRIDRSWRVASYSQLSAGPAAPGLRLEDPERPDRDRYDAGDPGAEGAGGGAGEPEDLLDFPGGTRAGNFFHELFEEIPFGPAGGAVRNRLVERKLERYRFDPRWRLAVRNGLQRVLTTPLLDGKPGMVLSGIRRRQRTHELPFFFPLRKITGAELSAMMPPLSGSAPGAAESPGAGRLLFSPVRGFLKGYIDLIFLYETSFYLVDWKSNRIGAAFADYDRDGIARAMDAGQYALQYTLYTVALDLFLRERIPGYRYRTHFGGVFYLFIRGMHPDRGPDFGVFFDRPEPDRLAQIREALVAV